MAPGLGQDAGRQVSLPLRALDGIVGLSMSHPRSPGFYPFPAPLVAPPSPPYQPSTNPAFPLPRPVGWSWATPLWQCPAAEA